MNYYIFNIFNIFNILIKKLNKKLYKLINNILTYIIILIYFKWKNNIHVNNVIKILIKKLI